MNESKKPLKNINGYKKHFINILEKTKLKCFNNLHPSTGKQANN